MREWTIAELHQAYRSGEIDPLSITKRYLERIDRIDRSGPSINSIIEINPDALDIAQELTDQLSQWQREARGLLFGIPILLKENIDTGDRMLTTAGSLALVDAPAPEDAFLVRRLRAEGAIILGKTNPSEWANFRSTRSNSGWSSRGGQSRNPYVLDRNPCGSSSGSAGAIAANLAVAAVGTETDGSVTCPAAHCSLVGLKPTIGTVSRSGIIPISASQDTAGPIARTAADAAILLQAMAGRDPEDPACHEPADYLSDLSQEAAPPGQFGAPAGSAQKSRGNAGYLTGKRIGVARSQADVHPSAAKPFADALRSLEAAGAVLVDPTDLPDLSAAAQHELTLLRYEFKQGLADYFARRNGGAGGGGGGGGAAPDNANAAGSGRAETDGGRTGPAPPDKAPATGGGPGPPAPNRTTIRTIHDIIAFNEAHADSVLKLFGQEHMLAAAECGPLTDQDYQRARSEAQRIAASAIDDLLQTHRLDAIVAPTNGPAWLIDHVNGDYFTGGAMSTAPAISGYPHITLPMGYHRGLPLGLSLIAGYRADATLLAFAHAFELASPVRRPPEYAPTLGLLD